MTDLMSWQRARACADGTHHEVVGEPLYAARFDRVGKYHPPGVAPVARGREAWHIDPTGQALYDRRFRQTFGFYEERAAVDDGQAWFHIGLDGEPISSGQHEWCGNFQEGCAPVRSFAQRYYHIERDGRVTYQRKWRYAGDFRDGIAVVQADDGRSTHIDRTGEIVHGRWFVDLDVFHKGYARARERSGWMHVNTRGEPIYGSRFAAVEPFYNGQARVETFEGGFHVINEDGRTLVQLRSSSGSDFMRLSSDLVGYWRTHAIAAAIELGVFEGLPADSHSLATTCATPVHQLQRLLRALGELGLVTQENGVWTTLGKATALRRNDPLTLSDTALEYAGPLSDAWRGLVAALRAAPTWRMPRLFEALATTPTALARHHRALRGYARHDYSSLAELLPASPGERVIDAGGSSGAFVEILLERRSDLECFVLDRPEVLALIESPAPPGLHQHPADLFADWQIDGDVVLLARVLHDWDDELALAILARARAALRPGGRVVIVEMLLPDLSSGNYDGGLCDLHLLVCHGGRERDLQQWTELLVRSGLHLRKIVPLDGVPSMMVAEPI